jgi:hypothetical protein
MVVAPLSQEETAHVSALSPGEKPPVAPLSQEVTAQSHALSPWLQLMLAEIARKREDLASAHAEAARRQLEAGAQEPRDRKACDYVPLQGEVRGPASGR